MDTRTQGERRAVQARAAFPGSRARETGGLDAQLRCALAAALGGRSTPEQSLLVVQATYPERVIVHPKAFSGARHAERFKYPRKVLELLLLLAGPYWARKKSKREGASKEST